MSNFYGKSDDFAFKVPTVPSRYQRSLGNNNQSTYNHGYAGVLNMRNSESHLSKLQEKIEVLSRIYPPSDEIWEDLTISLNHLCYIKISEQVFQPSSQRSSIYNGGSLCPSVYSQNARSSERIKNSYSQTAPTTQDYRDPPDYHSKKQNLVEPDTIISKKQKYVEPDTIISKKQKYVEPDTTHNVSKISEKPVEAKRKESNKRIKSGKQSLREQAPTSQDLSMLLSEDDNDSLTAFFQNKGRPTVKRTETATCSNAKPKRDTSKMNISVTLNRVLVDNQPVSQSRKRQTSQTHDTSNSKRQCLESDCDSSKSDESTIVVAKNIKKNPKKAATKQSTRTTRKRTVTSTNTRTNGSEIKQMKDKVIKKSKNKAPPQKINAASENASTNQNGVSSPAYGFDEMEDGSFFGDVSSIAGNASVSLLQPENKNRTGKGGVDNEMPLHFFSPFANVRSTSGFSAISTPLSKSAAKNVLGKRLKKPSVAAELQDQLKPARKRRNGRTKPAIIQPVHETTATTESECEASDFSDTE